jgi:hypothetical protein
LGLFVVLVEDGYSDCALLYADSSPFKMILTDIENLCEDFFDYPLEEVDDILEVLLKEIIKNNKKDEKLNKMFKVLLHQNGKLKKLEEQIDNIFYKIEKIFYMFIGIILSCIIFFIINYFKS